MLNVWYFACISVCAPGAFLCSWRTEMGIGSPATAVTYGCERPHGCWELDPRPLGEQLVFLSMEPPLYLSGFIF